MLPIGGRAYCVRQTTSPFLKKGDVIGCAIDLTVPIITFTINRLKVKGIFKNFNTNGMFYPCISISARLRFANFSLRLPYFLERNFFKLIAFVI